MKSFLFSLSLLVATFSFSQVKFNGGLPEYKDGGKAIKSLQLAYNCESFEYENWEDDDATDDELTVCIINSKKLPTHNGDEAVKEFENIASLIKKALKYPERYKTYYIIFVKSEIHPQPELSFKSHTAGMKVPAKRL